MAVLGVMGNGGRDGRSVYIEGESREACRDGSRPCVVWDCGCCR